MDDITFGDWLLIEMKKRDWSQSDLSRRASIDRQIISNYINGKRRNPSPDICEAIARAFNLPPETVFRAAGLLPQLPDYEDAQLEIINYKAKELTPEMRDNLIFYIDFLMAQGPPPGQKQPQPAPRKHRQGSSPGEVVKDES